MKSLIVYFSHCHENYVNGDIVDLEKGNTQVVAEKISQYIDADLFEIKPLHDYPVQYHQCTQVAKEELENQKRPKIKNIIPHFEQYQNIYLGFPNWWGTMPMCVWTFLESYQFDGKDVYPFITHEGSGFGRSIDGLSTSATGATFLGGLHVSGDTVENATEEISGWLSGLGQ